MKPKQEEALRDYLRESIVPLIEDVLTKKLGQAITFAKEELTAPVQEPVAHPVIAGVLFDFMGWLTSRKARLTLSSTDDASPAVEAITEFAKMRGLSLDDARVQDWQDNTTPPAAPDLQAELDATNRQVEILSDALAESRREVAKLKELNA